MTLGWISVLVDGEHNERTDDDQVIQHRFASGIFRIHCSTFDFRKLGLEET